MRSGVIARDIAALQAATEVLTHKTAGAVDAVVAGLLAGATRSTPAALLGSAAVLVVGTGVGQHFIEGRARAPGLGEKRPKTPDEVPVVWRAAVPRLLECVLATHARFGQTPLAALVREAKSAILETEPDDATRARMKVLGELPRTGPSALARMGVLQGIWEVAGPLGGGLFTKEDLEPTAAEIIPVEATLEHGVQLVVAPALAPPGEPRPAPPPSVPVESIVVMDRHGVVACAVWAVAPECVPVPGVKGLSLPAFVKAPEKGQPRWKPGSTLPLPVPLAVLRDQGRVFAALGLSGVGDVESCRDALVRARIEGSSVDTVPSASAGYTVLNGQALWAFADAGTSHVRTLHMAC